MPLEYSKIKDWAVGLFSSLRLAVALLILLAAVSVVGTFVPQGQDTAVYLQRYGADTYRWLKLFGVIDLYHSWGFRILTGLLALNLLVCSLRRAKGIYRRTLRPVTEKTEEPIRSLRISNELPYPEKADVLVRALSERKFSVKRRGRFIYGAKGGLGPWGDMVTHLSILLVLLGAIVGSLGFVGTVNVYEGDWTDQHYNWDEGRDEPLGFRLYVEKFTLKFYPVSLKVAVRGRGGGEKVGEFETREGSMFLVPGTDYSVLAESMDFDRQEVVLKVYKDGKLVGVYDTGLPDGGPLAPPLFLYTFNLLSFSEPVLQNVSSTVRLIKDGKAVKRAEVEVNSPLEYGGLTIYQSSYARDANGRYYSGFQIVKDPGIPIVWAGFALLLAGLFLSFFFRHRQVWVYVADDKIVVGGSTNKDWPGFMRDYGGVLKSFVQEAEPL